MKNIYDIMNGLEYLSNPSELLIASKIPTVLEKMDEMLVSDDRQLFSVDFGKDCVLKTFVLLSAYLTINRIKGIKITCLGDNIAEIQSIAKDFVIQNQKEVDFWVDTVSSDFSILPIWDMDAFNSLTIPCIQDAYEYISIEDVISTYYTCIDSKNTKEWLMFLRDALLNIDKGEFMIESAKNLASTINKML